MTEENTSSADTGVEKLPEKIGFPQGTLFERPVRLDVLAAKKGVFAALNKPADVLFEPYAGAPQIPAKGANRNPEQLSSVIAAMRKQAGKPELERLGMKSPFCALQCDFEISGACVAACDKPAAAALRNAAGSGYVSFEFIFLARRAPDLPEKFEADLPMVKNENRPVWAVSHRYGRKSKTVFELAENLRDFQLWKACATTPRPHQIRLHAAEKGLKIIGESVYSRGGQIFTSQFKGDYKLKRGEEFERPIYPHLFLHLQKISFDGAAFGSPELGRAEIFAPLPKNFALALRKCGSSIRF